MQTTVNTLINLFNDPVFDDIATAVATLESQAPTYNPNGDINAAVNLVASVRTLSQRIVDVTNVAKRVHNVKNQLDGLPGTMRNAV
jgi:hypothetical protein